MEQKKNAKRTIYIILLLVFIAIVVAIAIKLKPRDTSNDNTPKIKGSGDTITEKELQADNVSSEDTKKVSSSENNEVVRKELDEGILYYIGHEKVEADTVIETRYFDASINDIYIDPDSYNGKKIQIEGMYLEADGYSFIGRYSTLSSCPYCVGGISYLQYDFSGKDEIKEDLVDKDSWIKVIGEVTHEMQNIGTEESPLYEDCYFLDVSHVYILNERGEDTVNS